MKLSVGEDGNVFLESDGRAIVATAPTKIELQDLLREMLDFLSEDHYFGVTPRSPKYSSTRASFIKRKGCCAACGTEENLELHHIEPFFLFPEKELDEDNFIALCRACHFIFGHLKKWSSYNTTVVEDAKWFCKKVNSRPEKQNE